MMHHNHAFYAHGQSSQAPSIRLGGAGVVPTLINISGEGFSSSHQQQEPAQKIRSTVEKHIEIVEYLKRLPDSSWVSNQFNYNKLQ